jgi:hypothetical protein
VKMAHSESTSKAGRITLRFMMVREIKLDLPKHYYEGFREAFVTEGTEFQDLLLAV